MNSQNGFLLRLFAIAGVLTSTSFLGFSAVSANNQVAQIEPTPPATQPQQQQVPLQQQPGQFEQDNDQQLQQVPLQQQQQQPGQFEQDNDVDNGVRALW